jgi:hypothetical protein
MNSTNKQGVGRREFLIMTTGSVLAAVAMGEVDFSSQGTSRSFSLGYAGPDAAAGPDARFTPNVMSVERVTSGDGGFVNGARVSVRGFNVTPKTSAGRENMELIADYASIDGTSRVYPFMAWSYSKATGAGHRVSFTVPLDQNQHLRLMFKTDLSVSQSNGRATPATLATTRRNLLSTLVSESADAADPDAITLTLRGETGLPRLRRGYYVIAPAAAGVSEPDWSRFQVRSGENGLKLFAMNGFDAEPVDFEYLILQLDYVVRPDEDAPESRKPRSR